MNQTELKKQTIELLTTICTKYPEMRITQIIDNALEMFGLSSKELYYISDKDLYNALDNFYKKLIVRGR